MLASAVALGIGFGLFYEIIRLLKLIVAPQQEKMRRLRKWVLHILTFLGDFIFVMVFGIVAILQTYKISGGVFRGLTYIGLSSGFLFYYFIIGRLTKKISIRVAWCIKTVLRFMWKIITIPLCKIFLLFLRLYGLTIGKIIGKIICRIKQRRVLKTVVAENTELLNIRAVEGTKGYKKEGRISFGGKGAT